ncbi:MAG TPA: 23S rRNA (guanosine(2251)-2'-O)-methyltransferase RlmB [Steroidobacteraceae bacterium]|jgi:23S rRNA (guanosine2251-2'-O)-methyltransferase
MSTGQLVYGLHAVQSLLKRHPDRVLELRLAERRDDPRIRTLEALAREQGTKVLRVDAQALQQALGDVAHQGVAAEVLPLPAWSEDDLVGALAEADSPLVLALDGVQDPHNLGACLRTADACGALAVVVPKDRATNLTPVVRKVAAGAAESVPLVTVTNLVRTLKLLKAAGLWVTGAAADAPQTAAEVDFTGGTVLVMGGEGAGLRQLTRQTCDHMVRLPQLGSVESLNVSVAAGMLLYEVVRQRSKK